MPETALRSTNRAADVGISQSCPTSIGVVVASTPHPLSRMVKVEFFIAAMPEGILMLQYAIVFFVIALIAALLGFGGIAAGAAGIVRILRGFLISAVVALLCPRRI